jgi:hypothetical protein
VRASEASLPQKEEYQVKKSDTILLLEDSNIQLFM